MDKWRLDASMVRTNIGALSLAPVQCSFMEYRSIKLVFRRYASLFFIVGIDSTDVGSIFTHSKQHIATHIFILEIMYYTLSLSPLSMICLLYSINLYLCSCACSSLTRFFLQHYTSDTWVTFAHSIAPPQNELSILEFIHMTVETLDQYFDGVVRVSSPAYLIPQAHEFFSFLKKPPPPPPQTRSL